MEQEGEPTQKLIEALQQLDETLSAKIDYDVDTIARAFSDAYEIEQSRRIADFVLAPLTVVEQALAFLSFATSTKEIPDNLDPAESVLGIASLLMGIGQLQQAGEKLQLAMDGPTYGSVVGAMLEEAARSTIPGEYADTIKLHLYGVGGRQSPVWGRYGG